MDAMSKPPGLRDIAAAAGVSIGTVDRALHGKPGISDRTRTRVLDAARKLGYRPNLAARSLSSRKRTRIAVVLPARISLFYDDVRAGIRDAASVAEATGSQVVW